MAEKHTADPVEIMRATGHPELEYAAGWTIAGLVTIGTIVGMLAGFAGAAADAFTLFTKFEDYLDKYHGNLERSAVELAKEWRTDKYLRHLEALLAVLNSEKALVISGTGELIEPDDGIVAIGSGGSFALAAARMLVKHSTLNARDIVEESLKTAGDICIYTNKNLTIEEL